MRCARPEDEQQLLTEARELAAWADVVILCIGDSSEITGENCRPYKGGDRDELQLIGQQQALLDAVVATGTPVASVLIHGRALAIAPVLAASGAVLDAWNPGEARGQAVAAALLGRYNPGGRLPISVPLSAGACPVYDSKISNDLTKPYAFGHEGMVLPCGYGLSYSRFSLDRVALAQDQIGPNDSAVVEATITNHGPLAGDEVILVYLGRSLAEVARPARLLKAFVRVPLQVDEQRTVRLELPPERFRYTGRDMQETSLRGRIPLLVGSRPDDLQELTLTITEEA